MVKYHDKFPDYVEFDVYDIPDDAAGRIDSGWDPDNPNVCGMCPEVVECKERSWRSAAPEFCCTAGPTNVWIPVTLAVKLRMAKASRNLDDEPMTDAAVRKSFTLLPRHPASMP